MNSLKIQNDESFVSLLITFLFLSFTGKTLFGLI